jgi:hypothetical protein
MKLALITFLAGLLFTGSLAVYTKEAIVKDYNKIFTAKVAASGEQKIARKGIKKLPETHFLSGLINGNPRMVDYLVDNYTEIDEAKLNDLTADPAALDKFYVESLKKDSTFNNIFLQMAANYLTSNKHQIKGITVKRDTIPMDTLMSIASKFFHADAVNSTGNIGWKIGQGIENISEFQSGQYPIAEAFCYSTILANYNTTPALKDEFVKVAGLVQGEQKVVPGSIGDTTLVAVRNGVNSYMAKSEALKQLLNQHYEKKKNVLNFDLAQ